MNRKSPALSHFPAPQVFALPMTTLFAFNYHRREIFSNGVKRCVKAARDTSRFVTLNDSYRSRSRMPGNKCGAFCMT